MGEPVLERLALADVVQDRGEELGPRPRSPGCSSSWAEHRHEPAVGHEHAPARRSHRPSRSTAGPDLDAEPLGHRRREEVVDDVAGDLDAAGLERRRVRLAAALR